LIFGGNANFSLMERREVQKTNPEMEFTKKQIRAYTLDRPKLKLYITPGFLSLLLDLFWLGKSEKNLRFLVWRIWSSCNFISLLLSIDYSIKKGRKINNPLPFSSERNSEFIPGYRKAKIEEKPATVNINSQKS
jgi:hypothetical protein